MKELTVNILLQAFSALAGITDVGGRENWASSSGTEHVLEHNQIIFSL